MNDFVEKVEVALFGALDAAKKSGGTQVLPSAAGQTERSDRALSAPGSQTLPALLVAISGGPDSTALLLALNALRSRVPFDLHAAHINHRLRGAESDGDQEFCQTLCQRLNISLVIRPDAAGDSVSSSEESLRNRRYEFLEMTAHKIGAQAICTGHTLDDQVETILFRLIRGTSTAGATGIPAFRTLPSGALLIRPLLALFREDVIQYLDEQSVQARHDRSNDELHYNRNFIRHRLIAPLKERFPGFEIRVQRFANAALTDNDFIDEIADANYKRLQLKEDCWNCPDFQDLHMAILNRIAARGLSQREVEVSSERIELLVDLICSAASGETRFSLNERWDLKKAGNHLWWLDKNCDRSPSPFAIPLRVPGMTMILPIDKALSVEILTENVAPIFPSDQSLEAIVDLTALLAVSEKPIVIRRRVDGDFIQPFGREEQVSLKKFLHTRKAAAREPSLRELLDSQWSATACVVLAVGPEILWIPGVGLSEKLRVRQKPSHRLTILSLSGDSTLA